MKIGQMLKAYVNRGNELVKCPECDGKGFIITRANNGQAMWRCEVCKGRKTITRNQLKAEQQKHED